MRPPSGLSPADRRALLLVVPLVIVVVVAAAAVLWERRAPAPPRPVGPAEAPTIAATVEGASVRVEGQSTAAAVVVDAAGGVAVAPAAPVGAASPTAPGGTPLPTPTSALRLPNGTVVPARVVQDNLRGLSVVLPSGAAGLAALPRRSSTTLQPGDTLLLAAQNGGPAVVVVYRGRAETRIGTSGFAQQVLDLELPEGAAPAAGPVVDGAGALVGLVVLDRQSGAPAGHVYAVPVEQAEAVIRQALVPTLTPRPTPTPRPTDVPDQDDAGQ